MKFKNLTACALTMACAMSATVNAKVSEEEIKRLGDDLTPVGAEKAGNAEGTIPEWTGSLRGVPEGVKYSSGDVYPDIYADDKILFTITAKNVEQYKDKLGIGQLALFEKYPDTFKMHIYPTHRDGRGSELMEERSLYNARNTELVNGVDGLRKYTGGAPFPIPQSAAEALWNGRIYQPAAIQEGPMDDVAVYPNGSRKIQTQDLVNEFPYSRVANPVGMVDEEIGVNAALISVNQTAPAREKGKLTILQDPLDAVTYKRNAWIYMPGSRRVRRAPTVGYDTPQGPGGLLTIDDTMGFNGAMDRYDWEWADVSMHKKEIYIPYHSYKFDEPNVKYKDLLTPRHANPDYMRYELHRVWIVEATLRDGKRHVYGKRRFYIDEDSWGIMLVDSYDGRGELWRTVILNSVYDYYLQGYLARSAVYHDLQSSAYIALRMVNEQRPSKFDGKPRGDKFFTPQNLRKMGRR